MEASLRHQLPEKMEQDKQKHLELMRAEFEAKVARSREELREEIKKDLETTILATLEERLDGKFEQLRDELYVRLD